MKPIYYIVRSSLVGGTGQVVGLYPFGGPFIHLFEGTYEEAKVALARLQS